MADNTRRFVLADLVPATRELFREYVAAHRACSNAYKALGEGSRIVSSLAQDIARCEQNGIAVRQSTRERFSAAQRHHDELNRKAETAQQRATKAREAAQRAMEQAGYPWEWWWSGTMRIPAGQEPIPQWTRTDRNRYRANDRADCPSWPSGCRRCR